MPERLELPKEAGYRGCCMTLCAVLSASYPQQVMAMLVEKLLATLLVARMLLEVRYLRMHMLLLSLGGWLVSGAEAAAVEAVDARAAGVAEGGGVVKHVQSFGPFDVLLCCIVVLGVLGENEEVPAPEEVNSLE